MFSIEQSIADWRQQMLAAGIKTPVPLEELEIHLREEIEQQIQLGLNPEKAFESAVQKIGQADLLKTEFKKVGGFIGWLGENKTARTNRIFGALWLAYCSWIFFLIAAPLFGFFLSPKPRLTPDFLLALIAGWIYLRGIIGSILLFRGITRDRRMIRMLALLSLMGCVVQFNALKTISVLLVAHAAFSLVSIWFLRPPKKKTPSPAGN